MASKGIILYNYHRHLYLARSDEMAGTDIYTTVMILFLVIIIGYASRKSNIITKDLNSGLSNLLINITLPLLIISSFHREFNSELMKKGSLIIVLGFAIHLFLFLLSRLFFIKNEDYKQKVLTFYCTFSNTGFMGFPILKSLYGDIGVFYAALFNISFNVLVWTLGVGIFTGDKSLKSLKKILLNRSFIAVIIGIFIFIFSIELPKSVWGAVDMVGHTTTPLSMIIIGSMLAEIKIRDIFSDFSIYYGSIIRLLIFPIILYFMLSIIGVEEEVRNICVILEAMPAAVTTAIIADKYEGDGLYASQSVFISTIICLLSIPIVIRFLGV